MRISFRTFTSAALLLSIYATQAIKANAAASLSALTINPASIVWGQSTTGTVTLSAAAPAGGASVLLSATGQHAFYYSMPSSVQVAAGATSATFQVTTSQVYATEQLTIGANYGGTGKTASLTVDIPKVTAITLNPGAVSAGTSAEGAVTLNGPAPEDTTVYLSSKPSLYAKLSSSTVTVRAGQTSAPFSIASAIVAAPVAVTVTAQTSSNSPVFSATLNINLTTRGRTWFLKNVTFTDGGTANGYFTYDADTGEFLDANITTTAGPKSKNTPWDQLYSYPDPYPGLYTTRMTKQTPQVIVIDNYMDDPYRVKEGQQYARLGLIFSQPLTNAGGEIPLVKDANAQFSPLCNTDLNCRYPASNISQEQYHLPYGNPPSQWFAVVTDGSVSTQSQTPATQAVNSAHLSAAPVAPGSLISIFGTGLATATATAQSLPLPTTLANVSVSADGIPVPLLYVSPGQINAQLPFEITGPNASLTITTNGTPGAPVNVTVAKTAPGIFQYSGNRAVATNQDSTLNTSDNPAKAGSFITVYITGQGTLDNTIASGAAASATPLSRPLGATTATIAGKTAKVLFSGATPGLAGVAQVNLVVPDGISAGDNSLVVTIGDIASNQTMISVAP